MTLTYKLINGNSAEELKQFPDNHFDSVVTDPPYGINFLGKDWDTNTGEEEVYRQCLRVLKPGGHLLAFSAARTYHHLAMAVERSGFEIRDQIMWVYGSGFPKSQDVGRAIDKQLGKKGIKGPLKRGAERMINATDEDGNRNNSDGVWANEVNREPHIILPESDEAKQWSGWGTNLKPAHEPIVMAQKPFKDAIYKNVQKWGTGAINVDGCRVEIPQEDRENYIYNMNGVNRSTQQQDEKLEMWNGKTGFSIQKGERTDENLPQGRFPANFIHDGSDEVVAMFPGEDDNSAARFFKQCELTKEEICLNTEQSNAHNAAANLYSSDLITFIAQSDVVTLAQNEGLLLKLNSEHHSMSVTQNELKTIEISVMLMIQNIVKRSSLGLPQENITMLNNRVKTVATQKQTGTTMITISHWRSDGSAEPVTFSITSNLKEAGQAGRRFLYSAKVSRAERHVGHEDPGPIMPRPRNEDGSISIGGNISSITVQKEQSDEVGASNNHPTVKPVALMKYLIKLITPPGGKVLDPFNGSGSTGMACAELGMDYTGIELDPHYIEISRRRIEAWYNKTHPQTPNPFGNELFIEE
jgi:DNA modification methylase